MNRVEFEDKLEECIFEFDFVKVWNIMEYLDWKWSTPAGYKVPSIDEMKKMVRNLATDCWKRGSQWCSSGGFRAFVDENSLEIVFIVENYMVDFDKE